MSQQLLRALREADGRVDQQNAIDEACKEHKGFAVQDVSLADCDLSGLRLTGLEMRRVDLSGSVCRNVSFGVLVDCVLDGVDARGAVFARLERCRLRKAWLEGGYLGGRMTGCGFTGASLRSVRIGPVLAQHRQECRGNSFDGADLCGVDALGAYLPGTSFNGVQLHRARLARADLSACDLRAADLTAANLVGALLKDVRADRAVFDNCILTTEQAAALRARDAERTKDLKVWTRTAGPKTLALCESVSGIEEYRFDWHAQPVGGGNSEKLMITHGRRPDSPRGYAFRADSRDFCRMYAVDGHHELSAILWEMAADYADWVIDSCSIAVRAVPSERIDEIADRLRDAIGELFEVQ